MFFGFCNVLVMFFRIMDIVLSGMKKDWCLCYFEDVIVFGKIFESLWENLI